MIQTAIFPGSFDPITNGHINIIERALRVFDALIILIADSPDKKSFFSVEERKKMVKEIYGQNKNVIVDATDGLLMDYATKHKVSVVIRGLRASSDFEYEFQMASMNQKLNPKVETFFIMTGENFYYISSRAIKEVAHHGGNISGLVPPSVEKKIKEKLSYAYSKKNI